MTVDDDAPDMNDDWQYDNPPPLDATQGGGGGLLQSILDEVTALRDGARADRVALADALTASFAKLEVEIEVLREQVASLRVDLDAAGTATANGFTQLLKAVGADTEIDVPAIVERVVSAQGDANVEAVIAALAPQLSALRKAVPSAEMARIAMELSRLRQSLIGPDPR
jgi:hypothetical protein